MLSHNIFLVVTYKNDILGMVADARKVPASNNLIGYADYCKTLNVCKSWKEAQQLAKIWNDDFIKNGSQKR